MSPSQFLVLIVAMVVTAVLGYAVAHRPQAPKKFGLKEAENAVSYAEVAVSAVASFLPNDDAREAVKKAVAQAMVGSAVGLGYENAVAGDLSDVAAEAADLNEEAEDEITEANKRISDLKREIAELQARVNDRRAELAEKKRVAALFAA